MQEADGTGDAPSPSFAWSPPRFTVEDAPPVAAYSSWARLSVSSTVKRGGDRRSRWMGSCWKCCSVPLVCAPRISHLLVVNNGDCHARSPPDPVSNSWSCSTACWRGGRRLIWIDLVILGLVAFVIAEGRADARAAHAGLGWLAILVLIAPGDAGLLRGDAGLPGAGYLAGMQVMDNVRTPARGAPPTVVRDPRPPDRALARRSAISWPFTILLALFTPRQQLLHDLIAGTLMLRVFADGATLAERASSSGLIGAHDHCGRSGSTLSNRAKQTVD